MKLFKVPYCKLTVAERWGSSFLVIYPVSYRYNGGIIIDGEWYDGFDVAIPRVPAGFTLESIGCGLQMNARPPYATRYLKPVAPGKVTRKQIKELL